MHFVLFQEVVLYHLNWFWFINIDRLELENLFTKNVFLLTYQKNIASCLKLTKEIFFSGTSKTNVFKIRKSRRLKTYLQRMIHCWEWLGIIFCRLGKFLFGEFGSRKTICDKSSLIVKRFFWLSMGIEFCIWQLKLVFPIRPIVIHT